MPIVEALAAGVSGAFIVLACCWLAHRIFVVEPKLRRAQEDVHKAALLSLGQDRLRPMDIRR